MTTIEIGVTKTCYVKWFDRNRDFGFMIDEDAALEILVHGNVLRNAGRNTVTSGVRLDAIISQVANRWYAISIVRFHFDSEHMSATLASASNLDLHVLQSIPFEPARVKWFDSGKGIGFVNIFGSSVDIFIHVNILRLSGMGGLQQGEAILVRAHAGERGFTVVEVADWFQQSGLD